MLASFLRKLARDRRQKTPTGSLRALVIVFVIERLRYAVTVGRRDASKIESMDSMISKNVVVIETPIEPEVLLVAAYCSNLSVIGHRWAVAMHAVREVSGKVSCLFE